MGCCWVEWMLTKHQGSRFWAIFNRLLAWLDIYVVDVQVNSNSKSMLTVPPKKGLGAIKFSSVTSKLHRAGSYRAFD